jgi:AraC-like DNA-binding protein
MSGESLRLARSWTELDSMIDDSIVRAAIIDPAADGSMKINAVARLFKRHTGVPTVAYVPLSGRNFKAIFMLSRIGLSEALVHPVRQDHFWQVIERVSSGKPPKDFLSFMAISRVNLPPSLALAVRDMFERPERYETATDIALQARFPVKRVYRSFQAAKLGTPKRLLTAAKVLRAYGYLRGRRYKVDEARVKVGYSDSRIFAEHVRAIFGCTPSSLRAEPNQQEVLRQALEWFCKPIKE